MSILGLYIIEGNHVVLNCQVQSQQITFTIVFHSMKFKLEVVVEKYTDPS